MDKYKSNNYDNNSKGPDIAFQGFWDHDLARIEFDDCFKVIDSTTDAKTYYYVDYGNLPSVDDIEIGGDVVQYVTKGYSQGDECNVIVNHKALGEVWGNEVFRDDLQKTIDRMFWDSPVYVEVTINGDSWCYNDLMEDPYKWDHEEFAKQLSEVSKVAVAEITAVIPKELEHG